MNRKRRKQSVASLGRDLVPTTLREAGPGHAKSLMVTVAGIVATVVGLLVGSTVYADSHRGVADGTMGRHSERSWVGAWSGSPQIPTPLFVAPAEGFNNQTIRNIVHTSVGGNAVRLWLTNAFGTQPVTFNAIYVGIQQSGADLVRGSNHPVTFGGNGSVTIPVGAEALSDPVPLAVESEQNLAISLFSSGRTGRPTAHSFAQQTNYVSDPGNFAPAIGAAGFTATSTSWVFLDGIDVLTPARIKGAVVTLGDSITDGFASTVDANERWPDFLAPRFLSGPPGLLMSVLNEAITGNRVLNDSTCLGINAVARLDRDVLTQTGVTHLIVLAGINDIGYSTAPDVFFSECFLPRPDLSPAEIISGYQQIIAQAHAMGVKVFGRTLTPFKGFFYWTEAEERKRQTINRWSRTSHAVDAVIDFAAAVAYRGDPTVLAPEHDSGDHAHVNAAGAQAMADAIDLSLFQADDG